jgi:hypothetical protein
MKDNVTGYGMAWNGIALYCNWLSNYEVFFSTMISPGDRSKSVASQMVHVFQLLGAHHQLRFRVSRSHISLSDKHPDLHL